MRGALLLKAVKLGGFGLKRQLHASTSLSKQLSEKESARIGRDWISSYAEEHRSDRSDRSDQGGNGNPLGNTTRKDEDGLRTFLSRVVKHMAGGLFITTSVVGASIAMMSSATTDIFVPGLFVVGAIGSLASAFAIGAINPHYSTTGNVTTAITKPSRMVAFVTLSVSMGLVTAPLIAMCDPTIVLAAAGISGGMMAGMVHYAMSTPKTLLNWGPALHIGVWTLIGNCLLALFLGVPEPMVWLDIVGGTGLFMGITAYDTQRAIEAYNNQKPDHIGHATNFYLDFINIFIRVLEALSKVQQKQ